MEKNQNNQGNQQSGSKVNQSTKEENKKVTDPNNPVANKNQQQKGAADSQGRRDVDVMDKDEERDETAEETNDSDSIQNEKKEGNQNSKKENM